MTYQDWTIREKDKVRIIRVEGNDYVEVPGTTENYMAGYPDTVANAVLERDKNKIKVVLGQIRYIYKDGIINEVKSTPQTVWLTLIGEYVTPDSDEDSYEDQVDGFIIG